MLSLKNPIPQAVLDPKRLKDRIKGFNIYPYAGDSRQTSHNLLKVLYDLYEMSPSRGTVINDKRDIGFTGKCDLGHRGVRGISFDDKEVSSDEKAAFLNRLEDVGVEFMDLIDLAYQGEEDISICGNVFILYKESVVAGIKRVKLTVLDPRHCYPLIVAENEADAILWTPQMGDENVQDFEVYNTYPYMDDERKTVFHFKIGGKGVWGRPVDIMAFKWMITEAAIGTRESKLANTDLAAKILIIAEDEEPDSPLDGEEDEDGASIDSDLHKQIVRLKAITGIDSDESTAVAGLVYPFGGQRPIVEKLDISRDSEYLRTQTEIASDHIYAANSWSKELVGFTQASGGIGSNMINSLFKWKFVTKIKPRQEWWTMKIGVILDHIFDDRVNESIIFPNRLEQFIEEHEDIDNKGGSANIGGVNE